MFDVTALGEILIDFTPAGVSEQGNTLFERNPGGAPANVAACVARLGGSSAFIGKAGDDIFGHYLKKALNDAGVNDSGLVLTGVAGTTLAFVELKDSGERDFSFYRDPGADTLLKPAEVKYELIRQSRFFHFGSLSLTHANARSATLKALKTAQKAGIPVSYDPNLRPSLWKSLEEAKKRILSVMHYASIVKVSSEELEFLTGGKELEKGAQILIRQYKIPLLLVTMGRNGASAYFSSSSVYQKAFTELKTIDTTGAGDAFLGAFLYAFIHEENIDINKPDRAGMEKCLRFACAAAALATTRKGAIPAIPAREEVAAIL